MYQRPPDSHCAIRSNRERYGATTVAFLLFATRFLQARVWQLAARATPSISNLPGGSECCIGVTMAMRATASAIMSLHRPARPLRYVDFARLVGGGHRWTWVLSFQVDRR